MVAEIPHALLGSSAFVTVASVNVSEFAPWIGYLTSAGLLAWSIYSGVKTKVREALAAPAAAVDRLLEDLDDVDDRAVTDDDVRKFRRHRRPFQRLARVHQIPELGRISEALTDVSRIKVPDNPDDTTGVTLYQQQLGEAVAQLRVRSDEAHEALQRLTGA